jgi:hypothetical protein
MSEPFGGWLASVFNAGNEPATEAQLQSVELRIGYRRPMRSDVYWSSETGLKGPSGTHTLRFSIVRTYFNVGSTHRPAQKVSFPSPATAAANGMASIPGSPRPLSF